MCDMAHISLKNALRQIEDSYIMTALGRDAPDEQNTQQGSDRPIDSRLPVLIRPYHAQTPSIAPKSIRAAVVVAAVATNGRIALRTPG